MPRQITIGCSVRPDNRGNAHGSDMTALQACQQLFAQPVTLGGGEEQIVIVVRKVPSAANAPGDGAAVARARQTALDKGIKSELSGVDLLYIPGAPVAAATQATDTHNMKATPGFKQTEAISRDAFESALIEAALTLGIPVLAVCAGSWRLLEAFGGTVRELSSDEVKRHYEGGWNCNHGLVVKPDGHGLLHQSARKSGSKGPEFQGSNSTHWAVAATDRDGKLVKHGSLETRAARTIPAPVTPDPRPSGLNRKQVQRWNQHERQRVDATNKANRAAHANTPGRAFRNPGELLEVMVKEGTMKKQGTVEGFESASGAPVAGVQWHPESFLPGMRGHGESYANATTISFSQNIFMNMVLAAVASQIRRKSAIPELKRVFAAAADPRAGLTPVPEDKKHYRPDRYAPGEV